MLNKFLLSLIFLTVFSFAGFAQEKTEPTRYGGSIRGETYSYKYSEQDFLQTPSWKAEDGEPPVSISRAVKIARENLSRFVENSENFKVQRVHLQELKNDKWFYNISFICLAAACRNLPARQFSIIVKMDGSIIEPKKVVVVD